MELSRGVLRSGQHCTVFAILVNDRCEALEFLMELPEDVRLKLEAVIRRLAAGGFIPNQEKFRRLDDGVYELKLRHPPVRLFCFQDSRDWICTHGLRKPGRRELHTHVAKVRALRRRWLEEHQ